MTNATINLTGYATLNQSKSDTYQADLGWAILAGTHTVAALATATEMSTAKVTYHLKKMAAKGQILLTKERNENGRMILVANHVTQGIELNRRLPQAKTVEAEFERLVRIAPRDPAHLSRACAKLAKLGKRQANVALLDLASALNEQRHLVIQMRLGNAAEATYHAGNRARYIASAKRYIARKQAA